MLLLVTLATAACSSSSAYDRCTSDPQGNPCVLDKTACCGCYDNPPCESAGSSSGGGAPDAATGADATLDAAADVTASETGSVDSAADASSDGATACTSFPSGVAFASSPPCAGSSGLDPSSFSWLNLSCDGGPIACCSSSNITPKACQCEETYDCACLQAHNACSLAASGLSWVSCNQAPDASPTITCQ